MELADKTWDRQGTSVFLCQEMKPCGHPGVSLACAEKWPSARRFEELQLPIRIDLSLIMCSSLSPCLPAVVCEQLCLQGQIWSVSPRVNLDAMSEV